MLNLLILLGCLKSSFLVAGESDPHEPTPRFIMGVYYPAIRYLQTRVDFQVALNFWLQEYANILNISPAEARLFENMETLAVAFDSRELDFVMSPPILIAQFIRRSQLADGFVGTNVDGNSQYETLLLGRKEQEIEGFEQLAGKRLVMVEDDGLATMFIDTLSLKAFHQPFDKVFKRVRDKEKQSAVIMDLFFDLADIGLVNREVFMSMQEMNPQIGESLKVLAIFPSKSPNYGYFHSAVPETIRYKITQTVLESNSNARTQQVLNDLRMSSLIPCEVEELDAFDKLIAEHQMLQKNTKNEKN